ncbi:Os03g0839250, partial [Oryza sativa Japonica Group]
MGTVYMRLVVWMSTPAAPTAAAGSGRYPASTVTTSYHHHSRQTPTQLGTARRTRPARPLATAAGRAQPFHRDVERDGDGGAGGHGLGDPLRAEVDAQRLEHGAGGEVRERVGGVRGGGGGDGGVLAERDEDGADVKPEQRDGQRGEGEQQDGALEREREEVVVLGAERLGAERLEAGGEAEEDAVAGDVGEADGERAAGEVERAEAAEAEHGHHRAQVDDAVERRDRRRHPPQLTQLRRHRR